MRRGFTLIEMVIVISIILSVLAVATFSYQITLQNEQIRYLKSFGPMLQNYVVSQYYATNTVPSLYSFSQYNIYNKDYGFELVNAGGGLFRIVAYLSNGHIIDIATFTLNVSITPPTGTDVVPINTNYDFPMKVNNGER
jgi:prepilin-type N-terminal cleavage/methylation domain-containing protein